MRRRTAILVAAVLVLFLAVGLAAAWLKITGGPTGTLRRAWKDHAIAEITRRTAESKALAFEVEAVRARCVGDEANSVWVSDHLLVMKNGDWIVCENICSKENWRIPDIFIGRGSDGKWYYSTFHFCVRMCVLTMDDQQPESLKQFADWYYLEEFDGRSDECLRKTWPIGKGEIDPKAATRGSW